MKGPILYTRIDEMISSLDRIMAKSELNSDDKKFLKRFNEELYRLMSFSAFENYEASKGVKRLTYAHVNYLLNSPVFNFQEKKKIKENLYRFFRMTGLTGDFSNIDVKNYNFNEFVVPSAFVRSASKRKEIYDKFKKKGKTLYVFWHDVPFLGELENLDVVVLAGRIGEMPLHSFKTLRNTLSERLLIKDIDFDSESIYNATQTYYRETKRPIGNIGTQIILDADFDIDAIKKGQKVNFDYSLKGVEQALKLNKDLERAGRKDVYMVFNFPDTQGVYEKMKYAERSKIVEELRPLRKRPRTFVNFGYKYKDDVNYMTLDEYFKRVEYYDKKANEIKALGLSPYEQYLKAFSFAKTFKPYKFFHGEITDGDYPEYSRNPFLILKNRYEVCVGYGLYLREILDRLGIECSPYDFDTKRVRDAYDSGWHHRLLVHIKDEKYNTDEIIISDPTPGLSSIRDYFSRLNPFTKTKREIEKADYQLSSVSRPKRRSGEDWGTDQLKEALKAFNETLKRPVDLERVQTLELTKFFWAMRNIKKKESKHSTRKELDNYARELLNEFLSDGFGRNWLAEYAKEGRIDSLLYFLNMPMFGIGDKLNIIRTITERTPAYPLFQNYKIKEIFWTNLKNIAWADLQYMPHEFRDDLLNRIFRLGRLNISSITSLGDRVTYELLGKKYTKLYSSGDAIFDTVDKMKQVEQLSQLKKEALSLAAAAPQEAPKRK